MPHQRLAHTLIGLLVLQSMVFAQLQFSGFADILWVTPLNDQSTQEIQYGQFELGLSAVIRPGINFEGAIAYNPETSTFEAGAGFIEIILDGEDGVHTARGNYLDHIGLSIGQFDVPFGIDWQHIASADRRLVSTPLLNEKSINGWNDMGLNLHASRGSAHLSAFFVNGAADGFALGGRAAYSPMDALELGASYFTQTEPNEFGSQPQVFGADIQTFTGPLATRMELHYSEDLFEGDFEALDSIETHHGFYLQTDLDLSNMINLPLTL
ncbi:MAG: hypothetical protein U9Q77_12460, partial [Candidatus Marinimicrobia bacterium]|nr:hypothetical protein [Candidatus Neomarinimicrobiota bacterium]